MSKIGSRPKSSWETEFDYNERQVESSTSNGNRNMALDAENDSDEDLGGMEAETYQGSSAAINEPSKAEDQEKEAENDCWSRGRKVLRVIWRTRDSEDTEEDRELYISTTLRELILYCVFLAIITTVAFGMTSGNMYYFTTVLNNLFTQTAPDGANAFGSAVSIDDFWAFMKGPLLKGLYWETWYNGQEIDSDDKDFIYYENKLLGVPRIRQVRVRHDSCKVPSSFEKEIPHCFAAYSSSAEATDPFGPMNSTAWNYTSDSVIGTASTSAIIGSYNGGGYYIDLTRELNTSTEIINELFDNLWLVRGTRAVIIVFTVYNANINLFCVVKLVAEFPATGGLIPFSEFRTVKLLRYVSATDYFIMFCEAIFLLFIIYYIIEEALEIKNKKWEYFSVFWNWLDILVIVISIVCAAFDVYRTMAVSSKLDALLQDEKIFPDFDFLSYWQLQFNNAIAIDVFLAWIKIFKYISFNKTMTQLSSTLGRCAKDLAGFAVMFFIVFLAFAQLGYLIFGYQLNDYRSFEQCIFSLFRIILGDFDFVSMQTTNRVLGPLYFISYVFFVFFVLINMFLAIINDTYSEVKEDLANQPNEFEMGDYFKKKADSILDKLNVRREKIVDIQKALQEADFNQDKILDFEEWRTVMKMRGYADGEIEAVFARYDIDGDRALDEAEQEHLRSELEGQKAKLNDEIDRQAAMAEDEEEGDEEGRRGGSRGGISPEDFSIMTSRVNRMEDTISGIVNKIDIVLAKMEDIEKTKLARREASSRILESLTKSEAGDDERQREMSDLNQPADSASRPTSSRTTSQTLSGLYSRNGSQSRQL